MKQFPIDGFEVITNSDLNEGRGHAVHVCYCSSQSLALDVAKGKGVFGTDADVRPVCKTITIYDTMEEIVKNDVDQIKKRALAKLTQEDRITLNLK